MSFQEIHPLVIHFPIALLSTGMLFDTLSVVLNQERFQIVGWWNMTMGLVSVIAAVVTGLMADSLIGHMADPLPIHETHGSLQLLGSAVFFGLWGWRARSGGGLPGDQKGILYLVLGGLAVALIFYGSHLGAVLAGRI